MPGILRSQRKVDWFDEGLRGGPVARLTGCKWATGSTVRFSTGHTIVWPPDKNLAAKWLCGSWAKGFQSTYRHGTSVDGIANVYNVVWYSGSVFVCGSASTVTWWQSISDLLVCLL